ncbi:MAG: hypothetical protein ACFB5Z_06545 [Elainellaceae cyanobacterium]
MALLVGVLILIALAIFAVENWSPAVPLVILGAQTVALPIALWVIGAILAGALTMLAIAVLLQLAGGASSGPRRPRGDRYGDDDDRRRRYVVDEPPDDGGPRRARANPYVDEVSEVDADYGALDEDDGYAGRDRSDREPRYRPAASSAASPQHSDDWDSFSQPRQAWEDWERSPRQGQGQGYRNVRQATNVRRVTVDQVLDVSPIDATRARREDSDRRYAEDEGEEEDWSRWSSDEAPPPGSRPSSRSGPELDPELDPDYIDINPDYRAYRPTVPSEDYRTAPEPDVRADFHSDYGPEPAYEPVYEPPYEPAYDQYEPPYEAPPEPNRPRYADGADGANAAAYPDGDDDYIVDYGDEEEIDRFELRPRRRREASSASAQADGDRPGESADDGGDDDWPDWEDEEDASAKAKAVMEESAEDRTPRDIYEVPGKPRAVSRSGSIYAYRYRPDDAEADAPKDDGLEDDTAGGDLASEEPPTAELGNIPDDDSASDSESTGRILTPPYRPDSSRSDSTS